MEQTPTFAQVAKVALRTMLYYCSRFKNSWPGQISFLEQPRILPTHKVSHHPTLQTWMEAHTGALCDQRNKPQSYPVIHPLSLHQHPHDDCTKLKMKVKSGVTKVTHF